MDWVEGFYSQTGTWWGAAESTIDPLDRLRARCIEHLAPTSQSVLELGCGYGTTAIATAETGRSVVGIDVSSRLDHAPGVSSNAGQLDLMRDDFYQTQLGRTFDVVCYWDGFGVGTDADQQRLLRRIADDWLNPSGTALIEVSNPVPWAADDGMTETVDPDPARGYHHNGLEHRRTFDHQNNITHDTWSEHGTDVEWTQSLRCYSPDRFHQLVDGSGLAVQRLTQTEDPSRQTPSLGIDDLLYLAVLTRS